MKIIEAKTYEDMSRKAANIISAQVIMKPNCVLGLATGGTPVGIYEQLIDWYRKGDIDFSEVTTINLDEYRGLPRESIQSYWTFMHEHFFDHVNIRPENINLPDGTNQDAQEEGARYDRLIMEKGGIDLQLLGIGVDGHIGFNEPGAAFELGTHCVNLTEGTIKANARFFDTVNEVPRQAYTMGIKTIMQAHKVLMVVNGSSKAAIIKEAFFGAVTPQVPASILQMHPDFTLIGDMEALSEIDC
ncbi:MAG: glucosamine-6-phosphate deaminase [Clostridiales bacterium]|nr:glucosamine-6-phosphate deaminase [Clostridiales bacterium]